ncbi:TPA: hypothetical protein QDC03_007299 [Burkholderia cepacia]|uniref:hypothetical protein n=1 Tax=Burkholderia cepacia TaxID=292 RepID=UPI0011B27510|nr:hypothetical protein [Burkholderia cepacia]HDR9512053.1 hypothetical protein [Burkholderia cepacia]
MADETERVVEEKTFGPQRWIRRVHERGILTPIQLFALVLFALWDFKDPRQDDRKIVSHWHRALADAIDHGDLRPRDRDSLLPIANADGADWVIRLDEADAFVAAQEMGWTCTEIASHLYGEFFPDPPPSPPGVADAAEPTENPTPSRPGTLRIGKNDKESTDAYITRRSNEMYHEGTARTKAEIAKALESEMKDAGYRGERGDLSAATIERAIPAGLTGGRAKNGRKA